MRVKVVLILERFSVFKRDGFYIVKDIIEPRRQIVIRDMRDVSELLRIISEIITQGFNE